MAPRSFLSNITRSELYICATCTSRIAGCLNNTRKRCIGTKYLAKVAVAEKEWREKAEQIRKGERKSMLTILEERGLVQQITGSRHEVDQSLTDKRLGVYVGFDPTASSLHVGHMLPLMSLFWMYLHGYEAITLLGGATAKIGDPSDRLKTREHIASSVRTENLVKMHYQLKKMWINIEAYGRKYGFHWEWAWKRGLLNNTHWWNKLPFMEVLQTLGPGMRMGSMLARDTVKNKMKKGDGMSFAEFTYPLLQAWDWWHMYLKRRIHMQIGGSDQYGNITAGIDALKYLAAHHPDPIIRAQANDEQSAPPFGFTVPLLTTSSGEKFGKSMGNAVWLDPERTSSFDLYGYFMKTPDSDVERYLKLFTFMPLDAINSLMAEHSKNLSLRKPQHVLASEFLEIVHGEKIARETRQQHEAIWSKTRPDPCDNGNEGIEGDIGKKIAGKLSGCDLNTAPRPHIKLPVYLIFTKSIGKILHASGLASSNAEGHRIAKAHGAYVGGNNPSTFGPMDDGLVSWRRIENWYPEQTKDFLIDGKLLFLRRGKANIRIVEVIPDFEYKMLGETFPGYGHGFWDGVDMDQGNSLPKEAAKVLEMKLADHTYAKIGGEDGLHPSKLPQESNAADPKKKREALMRRSRERATPWRSQDHHAPEPQQLSAIPHEPYMRHDHISLGGRRSTHAKALNAYKTNFQDPQAEQLKEDRRNPSWKMTKVAKTSMTEQKRAFRKQMEEEEYEELMQARFGDGWEQKVKTLDQPGQNEL